MTSGALPPDDVLDVAGIDRDDIEAVDWRHRLWFVTVDGERVVLHEHPPHRTVDDVRWECDLLTRIADLFPVPVPIARFAGAPVATFGARAWSLLSYLDGDVPGWDPGYAVAAHGSFIARFHDAVADLLVGDRPGSIVAPSALDATIDNAALTRVMGHDRAAWFVDALSTMTGRLRALRYEARAQQLIHGDFTTRNVVASGTRLAPVGLLDFAHARREVAIADLAFGLWQAGRSSFETHDFDGSRITALVAGYHAVRPLTDDDIAVLPLLIRARGFVLIPRWIARGETGVVEALSRLEFLIAHERDIADAVATAIG